MATLAKGLYVLNIQRDAPDFPVFLLPMLGNIQISTTYTVETRLYFNCSPQIRPPTTA